jgi:phosphodiesterase/alkaline phosphatase D-like protein
MPWDDDASLEDVGPDPSFDADPLEADAKVEPDDAAADVDNPDFRGLPERPAQFPLGVMAGDADRHLGDLLDPLRGQRAVLRVLEMDGSRIVAVRFNGRSRPRRAGFVRAVVNGLRPNREHLYAFLVGGRRPTGAASWGACRPPPRRRARPDHLRRHLVLQPVKPALPGAPARGLAHDLDFFIHCGDHIYADHGDNATTSRQYRAKYARTGRPRGCARCTARPGMYLTWDDHEVLNNWNPETIAAGRLAAARQAFFEHRATRRNAAVPERLWRSFRWGRTAEVFVLDCRSERRPSTRSADPARASTYLSRAQMDWLKAGPARVALRVQVHRQLGAHRRPRRAPTPTTGTATPRSAARSSTTSRATASAGVVWLSGDVHFGGVCRVEPSGPGATSGR